MPTPYSYRQYAGNGATTTFSVPFPYLLKAHVHLYLGYDILDGTFTSELVNGVGFTWTSGTQVQCTTAPAAGQTLTVIRLTPSDSRLVDWQDGSNLIADDLDTADLQNLYVVQEQQDRNDAAVTVALAGQSAATAATAAATAATTAANNANATAAAATTAANSATTAAGAATTASTAATAAAAQASADAATAISTANSASTTAGNAVTTANSAVATANAASATANQAAAAVSNAVLFDLVANVAAISATPANDDYIEVGDSTGIASFSPLAGLPAGFVGDAGLTVRLRYTSAGSTWNYLSYFANDPETRYEPIGSGGSGVTAENDQVIASDYTLVTGKNASSVGPVSIDAGVTVTISANSTWVIF